MSAPRATVRLQFNRDFTLQDALGVVDYYARLGISHLYASPLQRARTGSTHGYDVVDYDCIDPALGGLPALRRLVAALRRRRMGLILDIVPNHMAASEENAWWFDVLEHGRASAHADHFDIDWQHPQLRGRVLLPFLDAPYAQALAAMRLLRRADGRLVVEACGRRYPLAPRTYAEALDGLPVAGALAAALRSGRPCHRLLRRAAADAATAAAIDRRLARYAADDGDARAALQRLLARQHYVLADWREAPRRLNWRRFFDVTDLIALRTDRPAVFAAVHRYVFGLYASGLIDGVRADHVDGLADPRVYCVRLLRGLARSGRRDTPYVLVEKILADGEALPPDWPVAGTTGYDFMDQAAAVLHEAAGAAPLEAIWRGTGGAAPFDEVTRSARREIATGPFATDLERLLRRAAAADGAPPVDALRTAAVELLAAFDAYRPYLETGREPAAADRRRLAAAVRRARAATAGPARRALGWLHARLAARRPAALLRSFQQLAPAVAAKAVEDTAFYRYGRLLSRNEVGADPGRLALTRAAFHAACRRRATERPDAMLATATHDHKRGEDVRARLAVLSELPRDWARCLRAWHASLRERAGPTAPAGDEGAMLLQTILGAWPPDLMREDAAGLAAFADRLADWQRKALREAKRHGGWTAPDEAYEAGCERLLRASLAPGSAALDLAADLAARIAAPGAVNGLAQTMLRLTVPGVPDLYRGCEYWDLSLVDPDNRRAVDHAARAASLARCTDPDAAIGDWRSGRIKQWLIARVLAWRARHEALLRRGRYRAVPVRGPLQRQVLAFAREEGQSAALVVVTRLAARHALERPCIARARWRDTELILPARRTAWVDVLHERPLPQTRTLRLGDLLDPLPVALLFGG